MASIPPSSSITSVPGIKWLIVDSSPLLTSPLSTLRGMSTHYLITPEVVHELRDKRGREVMREAELQLLPPEGTEGKGGFIIREPSLEAVAKVTSFARKTGDIAVLSTADIRVLALCLTLELEENGTWRVRDTPGQVLTGPPKPDQPSESIEEEGKVEGEGVEGIIKSVEKVKIIGGENRGWEVKPVASTSTLAAVASTSTSTVLPLNESVVVPELESEPVVEPEEEEENEEDYSDIEAGEEEEGSIEGEGGEEIYEEEEEEDSGAESDDSHTSSSSWITPENFIKHKVKDLGLFIPPPLTTTTTSTEGGEVEDLPIKPIKSVMKSAVLTGDFAMQNVALQMGLNVLGSGGKRVREVRTWVLRCHACYKICKNPEKRFCPSCGGPTLIRTSITYQTATPENPKGYTLHLKQNFQYKLRGTRYSLANPKMGKAGGGPNAEPVLREDQKEWIRGIKTVEMIRSKETRAILKSVMDDKTRSSRGLQPKATGTGFMSSFNDPDWMPEMNKGEKGRKRGGKNGAGGEIRVDSSGLPVIGNGRKNKNESRKRH